MSAQPTLVALLHAEMESLGRIRLRSVAGLEAVDWLVREEVYDLIIVDMERGVDLACLSRLIEKGAAVDATYSVVALADTYREDEAAAVLSLGAADYLSWADHREKLASVIAQLLAASAPAPLAEPAETAGRPLTLNV